jgi:hypothetical protein
VVAVSRVRSSYPLSVPRGSSRIAIEVLVKLNQYLKGIVCSYRACAREYWHEIGRCTFHYTQEVSVLRVVIVWPLQLDLLIKLPPVASTADQCHEPYKAVVHLGRRQQRVSDHLLLNAQMSPGSHTRPASIAKLNAATLIKIYSRRRAIRVEAVRIIIN